MAQQNVTPIIEQVFSLLGRCDSVDSVMPPTELFCEGWLLRVVFDWHSQRPHSDSPFAFELNARWYSEGRLSSRFLPRVRGDSLGERHTQADGVIGHFSIGQDTTAEIQPKQDATQLVVVEAKLGSKLSAKTKHAPGYDQAARNACCLAYIASQAKIAPTNLTTFAFYVVAPKSQIERNIFESLVTKESITKKVQKRAYDYHESNDWYEQTFLQYFEHMRVELLTWEDIIDQMEASGSDSAYRMFYNQCMSHSKLVNQTQLTV